MKKTGEFDRLRTEALTHFMNSPENEDLIARVKDIASEKLANDRLVAVKTQDDLLRSLLQDLDRYPIIDRALEQSTFLSDEKFKEALNNSLKEAMATLTKLSQD